ncbi:unknown [Clostridium sp. CAG:354]|nr:unknown [Clostridium sp. CAG:354]
MSNINLDEKMKNKLEDTYEKMRIQIETLKNTWNSIPSQIREQLNAQFNESYTPDYCIRWLETSVDDLYRNSDEVFEDLKNELENEDENDL